MLKRLIYLILLVPIACIDPYQVALPEGEQLLTVEGMITSGAGPHSVTLTRSATYGSVFEGLIRAVTGATVLIKDELGNVVSLTESKDSRGAYFTSESFSAEIGRSYTLIIETREGKVYTSSPQLVESVPVLESVSFRTVTIDQEDSGVPKSGVQFIAEINDPGDQNNYYYWRNGSSTYILETRPDLFTTGPTADPPRAPAPKACCATCFYDEFPNNQSMFVATDDSFNGLTTKIPVAFIEDDGKRFVNKFRVDIKQLGINQDTYRFLKLVKQQAEISGSIFDPPPATIRGNMSNMEDSEEVVLGYFIAAGESSLRIYVDKNDLTFKQNQAIIPDDCRTVAGAVVDPPADWNP